MKHRSVFFVVIVSLLLLVIVGSVMALLKEKREIDGLRRLTVVPTLLSEPRNRASYYFAAAAVVSPAPALREASESLGEDDFDWTSVDTVFRDLLRQNQAVLDLMELAKAEPNCRMPILCEYQFRNADEFEAVGDLLFWATLQRLREDECRTASEAALANLCLGRDIALTRIPGQARTGMHIYQMASRSLGLALTQYALDRESLKLLQEGLLKCEFPEGFDMYAFPNEAEVCSRIALYDSSPVHVRLVRALHLEDLVDIRASPPTAIGISYGNVDSRNPLMSYPAYNYMVFDSIEGMSSGLALLRIGVATVQYVYDHHLVPSSLSDLVPNYLAQLPENRTGTEFLFIATENRLEIVSPGIPHRASRRSLTLELEVLTAGIREDIDATADGETEETATKPLTHRQEAS